MLREIDDEMYMYTKLCVFAKWWNGDGGYWCTMADVNDSCHRLAPSFFEEMTRCQCQKYRCWWPDNTYGRSKFHMYCAYLPILCLRDRDWCSAADSGFWRSLKRHVADVKDVTGDDQITLRIDKNSAITEIYDYDPAWSLKKLIFCCLDAAVMMSLCNVFSYYHLQRLLFSPTKENFSTTLTPPPKNWDIHIEEFFVDSIFTTTIDIIK